MLTCLRSRRWTRVGLAGLLTAGVLALLPMAPAAAVQTISWTTSPPATAVVGGQMSFAASATANTFLGARITGCFVNFPDGNNYTNSFGGNFTTGSCSYSNRTLPTVGTYTVTIGFTLSTGSTMSLSWNTSVQAPTPTLVVPSPISTAATSAQGAVVTYAAQASDSYYGTYAATCTPASGAVFPPGATTVSCSATNNGGKTGTASFGVTVTTSSPTLLWTPPTSLVHGATYGDLMTAAMQAADATGPITYTRSDGAPVAAGTVLPVGADQTLTATYVPSGPAATAYEQVTATRTFTVERATSAVTFDSGTPMSAQYGVAPFPVTVTGTSAAGAGDVAVTAQAGSHCTVSSPSTGTSVTATVTITGAGTCVLLADQPATSTHTAAPTAQWSVTAAKANPQLTWTPPSTLTYGDPASALLGAVADVPGTFAYLVDGAPVAADTVLDAADDRIVSVVFTPAQAADYVEVTTTRTFSVLPSSQTVTVGALADRTYGDAPFVLDIGGSGPGVVSTSATGGCTVDGATVSIERAGDCAVTVARASTSNYLAADPVTRTFSVARAPQTVTVGAVADRTYGDAPFVLDVGGAGPGAVSATATGSCSVAGLTVTVVSAGPCTVTVDRDATSDYLAASAIRTVTVLRAVPILTWAAPDSIVSGAALGDAQLDASAGQPGTMTYTVDGGSAPARGQVLTVGDHVLHAEFVPTDSLDFTTATIQVPLTVTAPPVRTSMPSPASGTVIVTSKGRTTAKLRCSPGDTRCTGTVRLVALRTQTIDGHTVRKGAVLAGHAFALSAGATGAVVLTPTAAGRSVLRVRALKKVQLQIGDKVWTVSLSRS